MQIDIYIREKTGSREIRIPILPGKIVFNSGESSFITYDIMERGEVAVPSGVGLASYSWESNFPGSNSPEAAMVRGSWQSPETYDKILEDWKTKRIKLNLLITGTPINKDVYLKTYEGEVSGAFGDIVYSLTFIDARDITIKTSKVTSSSTSSTKKRTTAVSSKYTIKTRDTLWSIAYKYYGDGSKWKTIYDANKDIIESTAKKRGYKSSDNGHWIFPGVTITIPGVSSSSSSTKKSSTSSTKKTSSSSTSTTKSAALNKTQFAQFITKYTGEKAEGGKLPKWYSNILNQK